MSSVVKYIPNALSILRIILSFALIPLIFRNHIAWSIIVFSLASISDFLDGHFARKFNVSSVLGAMLDPLADKILMTISYFSLTCVEFIPLYVTVIVIGRDLLILSVVLLCRYAKINLEIKPLISSKINTTIQIVFIITVLACKLLPMTVPYLTGMCAMVVCVSTLYSGIEYVQKYCWIKGALFK